AAPGEGDRPGRDLGPEVGLLGELGAVVTRAGMRHRRPSVRERDAALPPIKVNEPCLLRVPPERAPHSARAASSTSAACPFTFTLGQMRTTRPAASISTVVRSMPM